jgi:hypothetical protein
MRLIFAPIVGIIAFCLVAPTFAQDSGSSLTQSQTEAAQSQSASQVASSGDSSSSGASQTNSASESNSASSGSSSPTSTAQPVTSVYSTVFETFSVRLASAIATSSRAEASLILRLSTDFSSLELKMQLYLTPRRLMYAGELQLSINLSVADVLRSFALRSQQ